MRQLFTQWGGEGNAATEAWVLKGFPFESRDRSECERGNNSGKRRILSKPRRVMEGEGKPPPYNYGAIPTDAGYAAPPPYPAGGI